MLVTSELRAILHQFFPWNKSRLDCLCHFIFSMLSAQSVNLVSVANLFFGGAKSSSNYRKLQRFLHWLASFEIAAQCLLQKLLLSIIGKNDSSFRLSMDRTNWKFGKKHINFLVVGIWYHGTSIPIAWTSLGKAGTSTTEEWIALTKRVLKYLGKEQIEALSADREFASKDWFRFLEREGVPFVIRVKKDVLTKVPGMTNKRPVRSVFGHLKKGRKQLLNSKIEVHGCLLFIASARNQEGELLTVVSNKFSKKALREYLKRWGIETLFGCLKKKGFQLEETHITDRKRLSALFFVLTIVTAWSIRTGVTMRNKGVVKRAKHGRKRTSYFQIGLRELRKALLFLNIYLDNLFRYIRLLCPKNSPKHCVRGIL